MSEGTKSVGYAVSEVAAATREANRDAEYYVNPNEHQSMDSGETEPAADPKDTDAYPEKTGGQD